MFYWPLGSYLILDRSTKSSETCCCQIGKAPWKRTKSPSLRYTRTSIKQAWYSKYIDCYFIHITLLIFAGFESDWNVNGFCHHRWVEFTRTPKWRAVHSEWYHCYQGNKIPSPYRPSGRFKFSSITKCVLVHMKKYHRNERVCDGSNRPRSVVNMHEHALDRQSYVSSAVAQPCCLN